MSITEEDRKDAMEWLEGMTSDGSIASMYARERCRVALAMLAEPRLPAEPTEYMLVLLLGYYGGREYARDFFHDLRAYLSTPTKPKTVWEISYTQKDGTSAVVGRAADPYAALKLISEFSVENKAVIAIKQCEVPA